jgi:hypothetical protein
MHSRDDWSLQRFRKHRRELLNWFVARGQFAHGATEGNNDPSAGK